MGRTNRTKAQLCDEIENLKHALTLMEENSLQAGLRDYPVSSFHTLFENSEIGINLTQAGVILYANPAFRRMFRYDTVEGVQGRDNLEFVTPEWREMVRSYNHLRVTGQPVPAQYEVNALRKDGSTFPMLVASARVDLPDGTASLVIFTDITERNQVRAKIARQNSMLHLLKEVALLANELDDLNSALQTTLDQVCLHTGWAVGHVYLSNPTDSTLLESGGLWYIQGDYPHLPPDVQVPAVRSGEGLVGKAYATHQPTWVVDGQAEPDCLCARLSPLVEVRAGIAAPILVGKRAVGVLEFFHTQPIQPEEDFIEIMVQIGTLIGRVVERIQSKEALLKSERWYRAIIEHGREALVLVDAAGIIHYQSPAAIGMLGYTKEDLFGTSAFALLHPNDLPVIRALYNDLLKNPGQTHTYDARIRHKDGSWHWLESTATNSLQDSAVQSVIINYTDVTQRKRREEKLRFASTHDDLTGLYNRAYLHQKMNHPNKNDDYPIMVVVVDLDNLKNANDTNGHLMGDQLLVRTGEVLSSIFRKDDIIARMGGDEFAVFIPHAEKYVKETVIIRIFEALDANNAIHPGLTLRLSVGISVAQEENMLKNALHDADRQMYEMKLIHRLNVEN